MYLDSKLEKKNERTPISSRAEQFGLNSISFIDKINIDNFGILYDQKK